MRNNEREQCAIRAASYIRNTKFSRGEQFSVGIVLGTGWGDALQLEDSCEIPGFEKLGRLEGHARTLVLGTLAGKRVAMLRGRVHMNEAPCDPNIAKMVRLQVEMLFQLGVEKLIITCAAGRLDPVAEVGDIVILDGFVTLFAPEMPLYVGEFCSPEDTLSKELQLIACDVANNTEGGALNGGYAMVRGPFFEGRGYDKRILRETGAMAVGMSMLPEACIAALYDAKVLGLAFITNDDKEEHSHEANVARIKSSSEKLGSFLTRIVSKL